MSDYSFNLVSLLRGLLSLGASRVEALHICVQYMVALADREVAVCEVKAADLRGLLADQYRKIVEHLYWTTKEEYVSKRKFGYINWTSIQQYNSVATSLFNGRVYWNWN